MRLRHPSEIDFKPPTHPGELVGAFKDTKGSLVRVLRQEDGSVTVRADYPMPEHYEDPSPHMNADQALRLMVCLAQAAGLSDAYPRPVEITRSEGRGFKVFGEKLTDLDGQEVWTSESSAVGAPCLWLFCSSPRVEQGRYERHKALYKSGEVAPTSHNGYWRGEESGWTEEEAIERWLRIKWVRDRGTGLDLRVFPRLDREMVKDIIARLETFVVDAHSDDNWRNTPEYRAIWRSDEQEVSQ